MKNLVGFAIVLLLLVGACTVKKPTLPEWDITLNIPLINQKYYMRDLVDSVNVVVDDQNNVYLRSEGELRTPVFGNVTFDFTVLTDEFPILSGQTIDAYFDIEDDISGNRLSYGEFAMGIIRSSFSDILPQTELIRISFVELKNPDGSAFTISYSGGKAWTDHDLTNCIIGTKNSGTILTRLHFSISATSSLSDNSVLGNVQLAINTAPQFALFQGILPNMRLDLEENDTQIDIEYPWGIEEAVQLMEADLAISIRNMIGFEMEFHGELYARNAAGVERSIPILDENNMPFVIAAANANGHSFTELGITNGVDQLLAIMPIHIEIRNSYFNLQSSNAQIGSVRASDLINGIYTVNSPFQFILFNARIIVRQELELEISPENRKRITNNGLAAELSMEFVNRIPIGALAELYISPSPNIDVDNPNTYTLKKSASLVSSTLQEGIQLVELNLNKAELNVFANPNVYMRWAFIFDASDGPVTITATPIDYIHVRSMMKVDVHIQEEK